jgi:hypothetical protein
MIMASDDPLPGEMRKPGALVEFLDGTRVIAVGVIAEGPPT